MAATERILIFTPRSELPRETRELSEASGLRIAVRTTSSSLSDYPEWNLDDLRTDREGLVTDGSCS